MLDLSAPNNVVFGRMMIWTDQAPMDGVHWTNIQGEGPRSRSENFTALYRYGGMNTQHLGKLRDCRRRCQRLLNNSTTTTMPLGGGACVSGGNGPNNE